MSISTKHLEYIANKFNIQGTLNSIAAHGNGHINDTYYIDCSDEYGNHYNYILQSVNTNVFKNIFSVMSNIEKVTEFLKDKVEDSREVMHIIKTKANNSLFMDEENLFWRMYEYINDSVSIDLPNRHDFYQCGLAFGKFQRYLNDFPVNSLNETIPDFHNTSKRYHDFLQVMKSDKCGRAEFVKDEIGFLTERKDFYPLLYKKNETGELPLRVCHNDTKCNNVLLDNKTHNALCVIDLDTIMPGFSVTDFGDAIRFGASTAAEDEKDLSKVNFDLEKFKVYAEGFLEGCGGLLDKDEIMLLPEGAKMITIECGMRFLTDYLDGDNYFRIKRPGQNLDRCRTQFKLVSEMESKWNDMKAIVASFAK